ncbi:uncharacterized protein LOC131329859 isoform X2 [Rhododendron vialii]|uniref:uncharacterized protein LOC131329859 isoform X2 n=1 Tax=Rhododendron vialii TaxID=182163 RepID=UPI00265E059E|nr:uncharacterized protein LOC131329859 isoform X2 [Rhododendron vialii]
MHRRASDHIHRIRRLDHGTSLSCARCSPVLSLSFSSLSPPGSRRRDGILEEWLVRGECHPHIQRLSQLLQQLLVFKKEQEDQPLPLPLCWHALYVLLIQVMYDASGVRLHAGRQAELLNQIVCELPPEHPVSSVKPLRDSLGHTPLQVVAGALLGCIVAFLMKSSS